MISVLNKFKNFNNYFNIILNFLKFCDYNLIVSFKNMNKKLNLPYKD